MMVMVLLLSVSLFVALLFLIAFIWSARTGQFEDRFAAANKILFENRNLKKNQE